MAAAMMVSATVAWPSTAAASPRDDAAQALGHGDGVTAGRIILARYSTQPVVLADIIYDAGKIAVGSGNGDAYSDALPVAYLRGGVSQEVANRSFGFAAMTVMQRGVTPEEGRVGTLAVLKTNAAYMGYTFRSAAATKATRTPLRKYRRALRNGRTTR
jgi:hypothetical protein